MLNESELATIIKLCFLWRGCGISARLLFVGNEVEEVIIFNIFRELAIKCGPFFCESSLTWSGAYCNDLSSWRHAFTPFPMEASKTRLHKCLCLLQSAAEEIKWGWCLSSFHTVETTKTQCKPSLAPWLSCPPLEFALLRHDWQLLRVRLVLVWTAPALAPVKSKTACYFDDDFKSYNKETLSVLMYCDVWLSYRKRDRTE